MRIEVVTKNGDLITDFELETNPFKIGEKINVNVNNYKLDYWNVEEVKGDFIIEEIEHFLRKDYSSSMKIHTVFTTSITVSKI